MPYVGQVNQSPEESCTIGEGIDRSYTKRYDAVLDLAQSESQDVTPLQIYNLIPGLPRYGEIWTSRDGRLNDPLATMRGFTGRRDHADKAKFSFTFNYSVRGNTRGVDPSRPENRFEQTGGADDLTKLLPVWDVTFEDRMYPLREDLSVPTALKAINAAGDPLDPLPEYNDPIMVLNYSDYVSMDISTPLLLATVLNTERTYYYATNSDPFLLSAAGVDDTKKWLITGYKIHPELIGMSRAFRRDFTFKYSEQGWKDVFLNAGLYELKVAGSGYAASNRKQIVSPTTDQSVTRPWPLNTNGTAITDFTSPDINYLSFVVKESVNYEPLGVTLI